MIGRCRRRAPGPADMPIALNSLPVCCPGGPPALSTGVLVVWEAAHAPDRIPIV